MEGLDLPVIPVADSVIPPVSGALGPTSRETAAGGDTSKDKSEGAGLTAGPVGGKAKEAEVQPFLFSQGFPPTPGTVAAADSLGEAVVTVHTRLLGGLTPDNEGNTSRAHLPVP